MNPHSAISTLIFALGIACIAACESEAPPSPPSPPAVPAPAVAAPSSEFDADIISASREFNQWKRLTRTPQFAPSLCIPHPEYSTMVHMSQSGDSATHGRKIYHLYALDPAAYCDAVDMTWMYLPGASSTPPPAAKMPGIRQVLVKDSFHPIDITPQQFKPLPGESLASLPVPSTKPPEAPAIIRVADITAYDTVTPDGRDIAFERGSRLVTGKPYARFIMIQYAQERAGTDEGWVYASVSPSGDIFQSGCVASCMHCHTDAPHGRLFGLHSRGLKEQVQDAAGPGYLDPSQFAPRSAAGVSAGVSGTRP
ncbi:MAG: hypothetical protein ACREJO_05435 [Phycisphaerales bacterium]